MYKEWIDNLKLLFKCQLAGTCSKQEVLVKLIVKVVTDIEVGSSVKGLELGRDIDTRGRQKHKGGTFEASKV